MVIAESGGPVQSVNTYNAEIVALRRIHDALWVLRVRPDGAIVRFEPGQYTVLGLRRCEPCIGEPEAPAAVGGGLLLRPYSFSAPLLDEDGRLMRPSDCPYLEFYVALVHGAAGRLPGLTPRLFALDIGDRLFVGSRAHGRYTLARVQPTDDVLFAATGTGEAPHNAMASELLSQGHRGRIIVATCVRRKADLGYLAAHRELERRFANYRYFALTTREPENLAADLPGYVGKQYLQDFIQTGALEQAIGAVIKPANTHVFVCGNPAMIGLGRHGATGAGGYPRPMGMIEVLEQRGFKLDESARRGNIHVETYW